MFGQLQVASGSQSSPAAAVVAAYLVSSEVIPGSGTKIEDAKPRDKAFSWNWSLKD